MVGLVMSFGVVLFADFLAVEFGVVALLPAVVDVDCLAGGVLAVDFLPDAEVAAGCFFTGLGEVLEVALLPGA